MRSPACLLPRARTALRRRARPARLLVGGVTAALALAGCSLPPAEAPAPATDPTEAPIGSSTPDPGRSALVAEIERLTTTLTTAREELAAALEADQVDTARAAADRALGFLVADPGATSDDGTDAPRPLFPAETPDRDVSEDAADQLTWTLTRARDVGGTLGNTVVDLLRDPIAGDLGAWQRDAAGVLASVDGTIAAATSLEEQELAVAELPGLGMRAVAWTLLAADAASSDDARGYAERGVANLDVILVTLERLEVTP